MLLAWRQVLGRDAGGRDAGQEGAGAGLTLAASAPLPTLSLAGEPTFRCELCDELFQSKLDLRRHKKYACGPVGAALLQGLGGGGGGQALECKDCERMFPSKSRCLRTPTPEPAGTPGAPGRGEPSSPTGPGTPVQVETRGPSRAAHPRAGAQPLI